MSDNDNDKLYRIIVSITKSDARSDALRLMWRGLQITGDDHDQTLERARDFVEKTKLVGAKVFSSYGMVAMQSETTGEVVQTWPI